MAVRNWDMLRRRAATVKVIEPLGEVASTATNAKGKATVQAKAEPALYQGGHYHDYGAHHGCDGALLVERQADAQVLAVHVAHADGMIDDASFHAIRQHIRDGYSPHWQWFSTLRVWIWFDSVALSHGMRRAMRNRHASASAQ